jgi:hypothetical protein
VTVCAPQWSGDPATDTWTYQPGHWLYVNWENVSLHTPAGQDIGLPFDNYLYYPRLFVVPGRASVPRW